MSSSSDTKANSGGNVGGSEAKMSSDTKTTKPNIGDKVKVGSGFRSKLDHYLYSGDKKHVFAGLVLITAVFSVPWFLMSRGSKHQSHQDYLEKADKARSQRLSSSSASTK